MRAAPVLPVPRYQLPATSVPYFLVGAGEEVNSFCVPDGIVRLGVEMHRVENRSC